MNPRALTTDQGLIAFSAAELRAFPGRWNVTLRCLLASALTIIGSITFDVPLLPVSLFLVFFAVQANVVLTQLVGVVMLVGMVIAVGLLLALLTFTLESALLRLLVISFLMLGVMWLMRATALGPMFYLIGLAISCAQPYFDMTVPPELFVRAVLWALMAAFYPLMLCLVINAVLLPAEPLRQLKDEARRQLRQLDGILAHVAGVAHDTAEPLDALDVQVGVLTARKLLRFAWMRGKALRQHKGRHLAVASTIAALREQALLLQQPAAAAGARNHPDNVDALRAALQRLGDAIRTDGRFDTHGIAWPQVRTDSPLDVMWHALRRLAETSGRQVAAPAEALPALLVPDALTNPVYMQYALKTLLAMLLGYFFLRATDWGGISTVVVTCLIVAQPSLGASNRKIKLRVIGAAAGSAIALVQIVFVMPHLDSIAGLLLMVLPVLGLAAYISAGSERTAYMGQQLMFTYALATLLTFGPTTDLGEISDRLLGIAIGIGISYAIQTLLWPEREGGPLAHHLADVCRRIAQQVVQAPTELAAAVDSSANDALWVELDEAQETITRVAVEPNWNQGEGEQERSTQRMQGLLSEVRHVLVAATTLNSAARASPLQSPELAALAEIRLGMARILVTFADGMQESGDIFHTLEPTRHERPAAILLAARGRLQSPPIGQALRQLSRSIDDLTYGAPAASTDALRIEVVGPDLPPA